MRSEKNFLQSDIPQQIKQEQMSQQQRNYQLRLDRMYRYPANYKEALLHRNANKFGFSSPKMKNSSDTPICPCCQNFVNTVQLPLSYPTQPNIRPTAGGEVFLLPTTISLYFTFIKSIILYTAIRFVTVDLFNLLTTFSKHLCSLVGNKRTSIGKLCLSSLYRVFPSPRTNQYQLHEAINTLASLNLMFSIMGIFYFVYFQIYCYKLYYFLEHKDVSQDDFTVLVENIPSIIYDEHRRSMDDISYNYKKILKQRLEEKIKDWIDTLNMMTAAEKEDLPYIENDFVKNILSKKGYSKLRNGPIVHTISICYDLTQLENLSRLRDNLANEFVVKMHDQEYRHMEGDQQRLDHIPNQIKIINSRYMELCHLFGQNENPCFSLSRFVGRAFVTFQYQHYRDFCMREYGKDSSFITFNKDKQCSLKRAPKPNDVFWYNMKVSESYRFTQTFYSYFIMLLSLLFLLGGLVGLSVWKEKMAKKMSEESVFQIILSYSFNLLMVVLTYTINVILGMTLDKLTGMERCQSKTTKMSSLLLKNVIAKVLNTTVVFFILYRLNPTHPMANEVLTQRVMGLITFSAELKIVNDLFQPVSLLKKILERKVKGNKRQSINMFQIQLNNHIQNNEFNLPGQYSYYIFMIYIVSFYSLIAPFANSTLILVFFVNYWVDKYVLFKKMSSPVDFGYRLTRLIIKCLEGSLLAFAIGHFYWNQAINKKSPKFANFLNIISIAISFLYLLFSNLCPLHVKQKFFGNIFLHNIIQHSFNFYLKNNRIAKRYWRENPATCFFKEEKPVQDEDDAILLTPRLPKSSTHRYLNQEQFDRFLNTTKDDLRIDIYGEDSNTVSSDGSLRSSADQTFLKIENNHQMNKKKVILGDPKTKRKTE